MTDISKIQSWLVERIAIYLDREPDEIDADTPLAKYGLDSVYAQSIATELSEKVGVNFDTRELIKHNSVNKILRRIQELFAIAPSSADTNQ